MGVYDSFEGQGYDAQLKCLGSFMRHFVVGDTVPVVENGFPETCTFKDHEVYVIIVENKLQSVTEDLNKVVKPLYDKRGFKL